MSLCLWDFKHGYAITEASLVAQLVKDLPAMQETLVQFLGQKDPLERDKLPTPVFLSFPGSSDGKESACNAGDLGLIPGSGRFPGEGNGNPLQYCCLENPHGQTSLEGYSPWGHKELDTTEQLSTHSTLLLTRVLGLPKSIEIDQRSDKEFRQGVPHWDSCCSRGE